MLTGTRTSKKCTKMKNAFAKRANLLFLIVKYANFWRSCRQLVRVCISSLIIPKGTCDNAQILNISILTIACNASKLVNYSSGMGSYNAKVPTTGDNYHVKYSLIHKQCIFFSRRGAQLYSLRTSKIAQDLA